MSHVSEEKVASRGASHVRFSGKEYAQIQEDVATTGKSIPSLLREKYFSAPRPTPLLAKADVEKLRGELARIGNNLNQIARRINSGLRTGFGSELEEAQRTFRELWLMLSGNHQGIQPKLQG